jgi:formylmethanofuran dehydrogenase subunit B
MLFACDPIPDPTERATVEAREHLKQIPRVIIHTSNVAPPEGAAVTLGVATAGIHTNGTVFRSDGVPLPLRPALKSPFLSVETVMGAIVQEINDL